MACCALLHKRAPAKQTSPSDATACSEEGALPVASSWQPASDTTKLTDNAAMPHCAYTSWKSWSSSDTLPSIPEDPPDGLCPAAERCSEAPASREARDWPADREVRGRLTLRASADHSNAMRAVCSIRNGVLSIRIAWSTVVVAAVPVQELAVGLRRGRTNMFTVATLHKDTMYDEIYCFAEDYMKHNKWIAVFRRMGVPVFDMSEGTGKTEEQRP